MWSKVLTTTISLPGHPRGLRPLAAAILADLSLLLWYLFKPSRWHWRVHQIDQALSPHFCLTELTLRHWQRRQLWLLLFNGFFLQPLLLGLAVAAVLAVLDVLRPELGLAVVLGIVVGLVIASLVHVAAGILVACLATFCFAFLWGWQNFLLVDAMTGRSFGLMFGLIGGMSSYASMHLSDRLSERSIRRQSGGIVVGIFLSVLLIALVMAVLWLVKEGWDNHLLGSVQVVVVISVVTGALLLLALYWRVGQWGQSLRFAVILGLPIAVVFATTFNGLSWQLPPTGVNLLAPVSAVVLVVFILTYSLPFVLANRLAGAWAGAAAGAIAYHFVFLALASLSSVYALTMNVLVSAGLVLLCLSLPWWRPLLLYPLQLGWGTLLYRADEEATDSNSHRLKRHPAYWDEFQRLTLYGLDDHLVLIAERNPVEGRPIMDFLSNGRQRWAVQAALVELDARQLAQRRDMAAIAQVHAVVSGGSLDGPASALLRSFHHLSQDVAAARQQSSNYHQRLALSAVADRLNGLVRELTRSSEPYALRFQPIAAQWQQTIAAHVQELTRAAEERQEIDNPYVIGVPLAAHQEIFVGRVDAARRIENLLLDRRRPPLLLYGQRRMGKTSLLNNLGRLLPHTVVPLLVDLQGPVSIASDHAGFFYNVARGMRQSAAQQRRLQLPLLPRPALADDPFTVFDEWLDEVESIFQAQEGHTILLMLDEFEALDYAFQKGGLDEVFILGTLRHLIQHRLHFKVLLAGSHTLDEFKRWSGYLINTEVLALGCLLEDEAVQLIEEPATGFALRYQAGASRRVYQLSGGHPFLLQLLCSEIVAQKNEQAPEFRRLATLSDVESAVAHALSRGSMFFFDIESNQFDTLGGAILHCLALQGEGATRSIGDMVHAGLPPHALPETLEQLCRRELLIKTEAGYHFQIELIRRWFARS